MMISGTSVIRLIVILFTLDISARGIFRSSASRRASYGRRRLLAGSNWKAALASGVLGGVLVYGATRYMSRRRYHDGHRPTVCENHYEKDDNGTTYKLFLCPRHNQSDDYIYCCGPRDRQTCCRGDFVRKKLAWWNYLLSTFIFAAVVGLICYCMVRTKKRFDRASECGSRENEMIRGPPMMPGQSPMMPGQSPMMPGHMHMTHGHPQTMPGQPPMMPGQPPMIPVPPPMMPGQPPMVPQAYIPPPAYQPPSATMLPQPPPSYEPPIAHQHPVSPVPPSPASQQTTIHPPPGPIQMPAQEPPVSPGYPRQAGYPPPPPQGRNETNPPQ